MKLVSGLHCQIKTKGRFHYLFIYLFLTFECSEYYDDQVVGEL